MAHNHEVLDADLHFVIDPKTRIITNKNENKAVLMQYDHNSERYTFEVPRSVDDHDMTLCNQVRVHYINTNGLNSTRGIYAVDDVHVSPDDENILVFSWLISGNATKYAGNLSFVVSFECLTGSKVEYRWQSVAYTDAIVSKGIHNTEVVREEYADVLQSWFEELETERVAAETAAAKALSLAKLADTSHQKAEEASERAKSSAMQAEAAADRLLPLMSYGQQPYEYAGNPVVLDNFEDVPMNCVAQSAGSSSLKVVRCGKNLLPCDRVSNVESYKNIALPVPLPPGTYSLSGIVTTTDTEETMSSVGFRNRETGNYGRYVGFKRTGSRESFVVTLDFYTDSIRLLAATNISTSTGDTAVWTDVQIEYGSESTDYEAYRNDSYTAATGEIIAVPALAGVNTLITNGDSLTVSGCRDITQMINAKVEKAVAAVDDYERVMF